MACFILPNCSVICFLCMLSFSSLVLHVQHQKVEGRKGWKEDEEEKEEHGEKKKEGYTKYGYFHWVVHSESSSLCCWSSSYWGQSHCPKSWLYGITFSILLCLIGSTEGSVPLFLDCVENARAWNTNTFFLFQSIPPLQKCCSVLLSFGNRILTIESGEGTHCIYVCN